MFVKVIDSAPSLGVYYFLSLILSVCPSVCHGQTSNCFFCVSRWNRAIYGPSVLHDPSTKRCSSIFDLGSLTPKIDSPKFEQKSPITQLVWQIDRRCLRLQGVFGDGRFNGTMQNAVGLTLVAIATKFGLGTEF